jgi:hypothetical protein
MSRFHVLALILLSVVLTAEDCPDEGEYPGGPGDSDFSGGEEAGEDSDVGSSAADCAPVSWVSCGDVISGDTSDFNQGTTDTIDSWPVAVGNHSGPELAWAFRSPYSGEVTWRLVDPAPGAVDHDLFVVAGDDACLADRAMHRGFNDVTFDAEPGETVYLVLDGFDGDAGPFTWELDCAGGEGGGAEPGDDPGDDDQQCCVWLDIDNTLNTFGAWGYPFNPVPAAEFCSVLDSLGDSVLSTPLTARDGCIWSLQPGESECSGVLQDTVSVACSSGSTAAGHKRDYMRSRDGDCSRHLLIDDNSAGQEIEGGDPEIIHVKPTAFDWSGTLDEIFAALEGC